MSYLIVFRTSPDVDHMAPLAWKLLEQGESVHAVMSAGHHVDSDHRLSLLRGYADFHLLELRPPGRRRRFGAITARARASVPYALWTLRRRDVRLVAVEWGYGLPPGYDRLRSLAGARAVLRSMLRSLLEGSDPQQPRTSFVVAARLLGIPTVCLPHGLSVKLDVASNEELAALIAAGRLDWRDRNRFAAYVLNTEHHRRAHLDHAGGDPEVMQTWGSLRWAPDWFELNRRLAPPFTWPQADDAGIRVVFMVPKWVNRVDAVATCELVRRLQAVAGVSLAVTGHPRIQSDDVDPLRADPAIDWSRIHDLSGANSVSVIREADIVIDIGSSIGLEVVMQGKVLVNPTYLHQLTTLFDAVAGVAVTATSSDAVVAYLAAHAGGAPHVVSDAALEDLLRHAVYGSSAERFDVGNRYYQHLRALAAGPRRGTRRSA